MTGNANLGRIQLGHGSEISDAPHDPHKGPYQWDALYAGEPGWDIGRPQQPFLALADAGAIRGRVLDVGCGTGEHVLMCAARGLDATGVDISATAIQAAERKARERRLAARFLQHDARRLADLAESFDTVLDCGLFVHLIDDQQDLADFVHGLRAIVPTGGRYFMLCFRGQHIHHRGLMRDEVADIFADGWRFDSFEPTTLVGAGHPPDIPAWLAGLTRI